MTEEGWASTGPRLPLAIAWKSLASPRAAPITSFSASAARRFLWIQTCGASPSSEFPARRFVSRGPAGIEPRRHRRAIWRVCGRSQQPSDRRCGAAAILRRRLAYYRGCSLSAGEGDATEVAHRQYVFSSPSVGGSSIVRQRSSPEPGMPRRPTSGPNRFEGRVLIGHNVGVDFDVLDTASVSVTLETVGLIDTLELAHLAFPLNTDERGRRSHSLDALAAKLGLDPEQELRPPGRPHRASCDAVLCWRLLREALRVIGTWLSQRLKAVLQLLSPDCYPPLPPPTRPRI